MPKPVVQSSSRGLKLSIPWLLCRLIRTRLHVMAWRRACSSLVSTQKRDQGFLYNYVGFYVGIVQKDLHNSTFYTICMMARSWCNSLLLGSSDLSRSTQYMYTPFPHYRGVGDVGGSSPKSTPTYVLNPSTIIHHPSHHMKYETNNNNWYNLLTHTMVRGYIDRKLVRWYTMLSP